MRRVGEQKFMSSNEIVGKRVKNPEGYDLGEISSLRVDLATGKVVYAVLKTRGLLGLGARLYAIPIEAMVYRPGDDVFVVNISKHRVDDEQGFTEDEWPLEANWNMIESTRPITPPSQEEARAATQMDLPRREGVRTEWVEVRGKPLGEDIQVIAEGERSAAASNSSLNHLSAADLEVYLEDIIYPVERDDLINHARGRRAPVDVVAALERFEERTYRSRVDVNEEFESTR